MGTGGGAAPFALVCGGEAALAVDEFDVEAEMEAADWRYGRRLSAEYIIMGNSIFSCHGLPVARCMRTRAHATLHSAKRACENETPCALQVLMT